MTRNYFIIAFFMLLLIVIETEAQELLSPTFGYSHKKTSYVTLNDGTEIKGTLKDVDRKKGLVKYVKIEDGDGVKHKLKSSDIKYMYLPPSGFDNVMKSADFLLDAQKWNDEKLDQDLLNKGYVYLENSKVKIKKKEYTLIMQLLNPSYCKRVKIYHDPYAKQSTSLGVGPVTAVGGNDKSYFVKIDDGVAYKVEKKRYKKEFLPMWEKCDVVIKKYPNIRWMDLAKHAADFTVCE